MKKIKFEYLKHGYEYIMIDEAKQITASGLYDSLHKRLITSTNSCCKIKNSQSFYDPGFTPSKRQLKEFYKIYPEK
jgi:hypothetical protein